ncbi:MAG: LacI family DNA-binding transcriptional regulator [Fusobacteriota bacterium]
MKVTIKDIAKIANVNPSTVSRSLNDSDLVSDKTKEKIKKIAKEKGFEFNASARSLSTKRTDTIGIIFPEEYEEFSAGLYLGYLMKSIRKILERESLDNIVDFPRNRFTGKSNIEQLIVKGKVDGLLLINSELTENEVDKIKKSKIPHVFLHSKPKNFSILKMDFIYTDHVRGGYIATKHLIDLGHKNIMTVSNLEETEEFRERTSGYREALRENNIMIDEGLIFKTDVNFRAGYNLIEENTNLLDHITGIFAQSDMVALGMIEKLKELGKRVPEDISVVGYDNIKFGEYFSPSLTTIHQPRQELAKMACERLIDLINGKKTEKILQKILKPKLLVRDSTRKIR